MKLGKIIVVCACLQMALLGGCGGSNEGDIPPQLKNLDPDFPVITPLEDTLENTLDNYFEVNQRDSAAGISILVRKNGGAVYHKSKGMADINTGTGVGSSTGFHLGSLSKTFTAVAVMQLYEQNQLRLDDSILQHMPEFDTGWQAIEIGHLLSHRAGIYDYLTDAGEDIGYVDTTNQKVIDYFVANPELEYIPGDRAKYVNTGFLLLAEIVARVSGMSFAEYMQNNIFIPAGMTDSYIVDEQTPLKAGDALSYGSRDTWDDTRHYTYGAIGQVSSTNDLNHFIEALQAGQILSSESLELMTQVHSFVNQRGYGYGVTVDGAVDGQSRFSHGGAHDGYRSILLLDSANTLEYVILATDGEKSEADQYNLRQLIETFYGVD